MKSYPSISKDLRNGKAIYAFDKLDGSNIRAEWSSKNGFYKFGTKNQLIDEKTPIFGEAVTLIKNKYARDLEEIFKKERQTNVVAFFEFFGINSFAGNHADEPHDVVLIDISFHKKGILPPADFIKLFKNVEIPKVLYQGTMNKTFENMVKNGELENMTFEGVVCKIQESHPSRLFFKIKNKAWIKKLKTFCKEDAKLFEKLS